LGTDTIQEGDISNLKINDVTYTGTISVSLADSDGALVSQINGFKNQTGVEASTYLGRLVLTSLDGRGIKISATGLKSVAKLSASKIENYGRISLTKIGGSDIALSGGTSVKLDSSSVSDTSLSLREITGYLTKAQADAMGFYANTNYKSLNTSDNEQGGVLTTKGAQAVMKIADAAITQLDTIRSSVGSAQNSFATAYTNAASMQITSKSAESNIRDLDFAQETANFSKQNILVQAGNYALAQANTSQQSVLKLLDVKGV
jgi:flagellin